MGRTRCIWAVFGGTETRAIKVAPYIGAAIAQQHYILLTGGEGTGGSTVKEVAITAASSARNAVCTGPWVGVDKLRSAGNVDCTQGKNGCDFRIHTDLGDGRNALSACLCDGAIALEGGPGTVSEAIFTLSLGKPVVFVGKRWNTYGIGATKPVAPLNFSAMLKDAYERVKTFSENDTPLDKLFNSPKPLERLSEAAAYKWYPDPTTQAEALSLVDNALRWLQSMTGCNRPGGFPEIARYTSVSKAYKQWLLNI